MAKTTLPAKTTKSRAVVKNPRKSVLTPELYNAVVRSAKLNKITLRSSHFDIDVAYFQTPEEKHKLGYDDKWKGFSFNPDSGIAGGTIQWSVDVQTGRKKAVKVRTSYVVIYDGLEGHKEHAVRAFIERVGRVATYSYFRSHMAQLSWESGADLPVMPVLHSL